MHNYCVLVRRCSCVHHEQDYSWLVIEVASKVAMLDDVGNELYFSSKELELEFFSFFRNIHFFISANNRLHIRIKTVRSMKLTLDGWIFANMYFRSNFFFFEKKYPSERVIIPRIGTEDEKKILILLLRKENNGHGNITSLNELWFYSFTSKRPISRKQNHFAFTRKVICSCGRNFASGTIIKDRSLLSSRRGRE